MTIGKKATMKTKQKQILNEITTFCGNECAKRECCIEEECILWRIEQLILQQSEED